MVQPDTFPCRSILLLLPMLVLLIHRFCLSIVSNLCGCKGTAFLRHMQVFWRKKNVSSHHGMMYLQIKKKKKNRARACICHFFLYLRPPPPEMGTPSKVQSHLAGHTPRRIFFCQAMRLSYFTPIHIVLCKHSRYLSA